MRKNFKPEQIVKLLRKVEQLRAEGMTAAEACKEIEVTEQTYYRWKKQYEGMSPDEAKRMKELQKENDLLKKLVAELSLDKKILEDVVKKKW